MTRTAVTTFQTIWDCRWSRPGYRVMNVEDHLQPEKLWVCVRTGDRRGMRDVSVLGGAAHRRLAVTGGRRGRTASGSDPPG
jgi:hypothetical protein